MSRTIIITSRHDLGVDAAKRRVSARFDQLKARYIGTVGQRTSLHWRDDIGNVTAKALGQTVVARIFVEPDHLRIDIDLPLLLAPFAGRIEAVLRSNADALAPASRPSPP